MTDQALLPPPDQAPEPSMGAQRPRDTKLVPWLYGLGFLILAAGILYLWQYPGTPADTGADASAIQAVQQRLADVDGRLNRLEQQPPPADLSKITTRLDALDKMASRLDALDKMASRIAAIDALAARVDSLDRRVVDQTQLASRVDTLSGRIESLSGRDQTGIDTVKQQLDAFANRLSAVESHTGDLASISRQIERIAKLQIASFALTAGRPIGDLPDAPQALARFAHAAPPTEAQLRLRFPQDERAALASEQPGTGDAPFIDRVWERAQGLVTIRRGDELVVGNTSAVILSQAQAALDAGDMAGAVRAVEGLKGQPAQAMAGWLTDAKALVEARAALADMAGQA